MPSTALSRVLCVDDDEDAGEMLGLLLKSCGIEVTCAQSAAGAWRKIGAQKFDLYLLDGWLPQISGFDFCRQIREFDFHTPILFYSGAAYDTDKQNGFAAGANAYVVKPDIEGLIETTVELIAKAKADGVGAPWVDKPYATVDNSLSPQFFNVTTALYLTRPKALTQLNMPSTYSFAK